MIILSTEYLYLKLRLGSCAIFFVGFAVDPVRAKGTMIEEDELMR